MPALSPEATTPVAIKKKGGERLTIAWADGHESAFPARYLRGRCPCAQCVSETTGVRMIDPGAIPADLRQSDLAMVGNYAITMRFSDGHHTGIYTFEYLRTHDPQRA